ncbi:MAG: winged helix-turn-helix domain-containing protein [Pyrinomonadaceae bacterium]|nr:winged helix-turn-helix domain-containing protein [Pyrinomonadaceae bacterium]
MRGGKAVPLTPKVYELLHLLVQNSGHMLGKDELLKAVWPDSFVEEGNLTRNISTLRAALGENSNGDRYIETVPKRGYRFIAEVRESQGESAESMVADGIRAQIVVEENGVSGNGVIHSVDEPTIPTGEVPRSAYILRSINRHKPGAVLAAAIFVIAVAAGSYFFYPAKVGEAIGSVAVLPFANINSDPNTEYLSEGISYSIIDNLSQLPNLRVIPFNSVSRYKGRQTDIQVAGYELNVSAVVIGRLVKQGDSLSIYTELVDVRDNRHLWSRQYDGKLADVLEVQQEISREISEKLRLRLTAQEREKLAKRYTENAEAYQAYLQGRYYFDTRTDAGVKKGIEYFEQAIKVDPGYAPAYVGLATAYWDFSSQSSLFPPKEARPKARAALLKALELDDALPEAHSILGAIRQDEDDWSAAERELKRAIELDPNSPPAHWYYARYLETIGKNDEAIAEAKRMLEIDPLSPFAIAAVGIRCFNGRRYDQAIELLRKAIEMDPNHAPTHSFLGWAYVAKGMYDEGIAEFQKARSLDDQRPPSFAALAYAYAVSGKRGEARKMLEQLSKLAEQRYIAPYSFCDHLYRSWREGSSFQITGGLL